jgi:hypothetical protein
MTASLRPPSLSGAPHREGLHARYVRGCSASSAGVEGQGRRGTSKGADSSCGIIPVETWSWSRFRSALPVDAAPINRLNLLIDSMRSAIVGNSLPTGSNVIVIIDDAVSACAQSRI